ncbi:MAG: nucleoside 2-deoxyribosyltransferase [archaeon]
MKNIYFAGSITGGRDDAPVYAILIEYLKTKGKVLTEHIGSSSILEKGEENSNEGTKMSFEDIYLRDIDWIKEADILIAEVTKPSLGVGYELGFAEKLNIPIICLYREDETNKDKRLSAMVDGNKYNIVIKYKNINDVILQLDKYL